MFIGVATTAAPVGALQEDPSSPTTSWDDTYYDDTVYDDTYYEDETYYDDTVYDDTYYDDTVYNDPTYSSEDPCDPAFHPDPASDPYCNVGVSGTPSTTTRAAVQATPTVASRASNDTPLAAVDPAEAPLVGAGRMLLAIDAIAELDGFERATTPGTAALLRNIRTDIAAVGLDETGYTLELEQFISDFIPFLESLETGGVEISDNLWKAATDLEAVFFGELDQTPPAQADFGRLAPQPWLLGLADLLVRGGTAPLTPTPHTDESDIRELLTAFAAEVENEAADEAPTTTAAPLDEAPPPALALETEPELTGVDSNASATLLAALAASIIFVAGLAIFLVRRRTKRRQMTDAAPLQPERSNDSAALSSNAQDATQNSSHDESSKASVTELLDASRRMSASLDTATIASIALTEAKRIVGAEGGIVVRRTDAGLDPVGCEPPMLFNYDRLADGCLPRVIETGQATAAVVDDEPLLVEVPMAMGAVPIVTDGVVTGAILVVRISAKPFNRDELDALEMLAPLVGSAFAVAEEHGTAVDIEPLTGLQNRRRLDVDLAAISTDDEIAYVMVDIDHFKNFNDTNGHTAGDEALRQVSAILQAAVRPKDLVYRYGGEEFCVLLPGTSAADAAIVAERARAAVEAAIIPGMENQPAGVVTISIGVSDSAFGTPDDLVERADAALYVSKRNGRNQVTLSPAE